MRKRKTRSATFYFVAAVFLACYLAETAECYRRRKPLRLDVRKEADSTEPEGLREGEILFGKSLKGPESQLMDGTNQPSSNASVEDEAGYQSLQCGADQMHFKVVGSGNQDFAVDQLNGPSLPLPLVPPRCGYNMRRLPYYLHLSIPYIGCHILKKGGHYMLPLTWRGIPIVLSCQLPPYAGPFPNWPHTHPKPHYPPFHGPPHPWHPLAGQTPTSQPTTAPQDPGVWPVDPWPMPQMPPHYPFPWYHGHHHHHHPYYNYPYYHSHPHHHHPYWPHVQVPTPDSPPMTTMMPHVPIHYPPHGHSQRREYPDHLKS
uniref:Uncharacterized protein n=1 Tax=Sphaeramia orbicularis TaxID=375764 RepID=A0A673B760_9TELE